MIFQKETEHYCKHLGKDFGQDELLAMQQQAVADLRSRNIAGAIIVPLSYLLGGLSTEYSVEHSFLFSFFGSTLGIAIFLRISAIYALSKQYHFNQQIWLPVFFWSNLFAGIVWGVFAGSAVIFYHNSLSITLIIILLAGISGGSMATYCIWKSLTYSYLLFILLPPLCAEFYIANSVTVPIAIAITGFLIFNLAQTKHWNKNYWVSLANTFLVKQNAEELTRLNDELAREITNHKQTADKIAVSRKKLQDIYNSAHDAIFIFGLDGKVIDVNETMLKVFRISRDIAMQFDIHHSFESSINKDIDLVLIWQKTLAGKDQEFKWYAKRQNPPEIFTTQINLHRTLWGNDPVVIATIRDITLQVKAQEATLAANRAKSEFLANMSHELRTPIHGILGYARLGIKRSDTLPKKRIIEYFSLIDESGTRLMKLMDNLLNFSKLEMGKMRYDMAQNDLLPHIVQITTELTPIALEKGLRFSINCTEEQIPAYCDQEKIVQVLRNLLFNAIKFSYKDQEIQIISGLVEFGGIEKQQVSVINSGVHIPEDELELIFDQFTQSSETNTGAGGTGLGLSISRQILHDHKSIIWAENGPNEETIFRFTLPLKKEQICSSAI